LISLTCCSFLGKARPTRVNPSGVFAARAPRVRWLAHVALFYAVALNVGCQRECATAPAAYAVTPAVAEGPAPFEPAKGRVLHGRASYYSDSLAGNLTANGERYDPRALTAAHRSLAFGTQVRVTRPDTGSSVVVRINDRGPFGDRRRIIDLSRRAAQDLGMIRAGVVDVEVEVLEPRAAVWRPH
jgi:rare lipoprotein A